MTTYRYSFQGFDAKSMVKVCGKNMPISHKQCYEIANFIRGMNADKAINVLERVRIQKTAVPYRRFNRDICHKAGGVGPGRYPQTASKHIIGLIKNLKAQAQDKGLDANSMVLVHVAMQKAAKLRHYGRKMGLVRKNTHFELVGQEIKEEKKGTKQAERSSAVHSRNKVSASEPTIHSAEHKTPSHPEAKTHEHSHSSQTRAEQSSAGHSGTSSASAATGANK